MPVCTVFVYRRRKRSKNVHLIFWHLHAWKIKIYSLVYSFAPGYLTTCWFSRPPKIFLLVDFHTPDNYMQPRQYLLGDLNSHPVWHLPTRSILHLDMTLLVNFSTWTSTSLLSFTLRHLPACHFLHLDIYPLVNVHTWTFIRSSIFFNFDIIHAYIIMFIIPARWEKIAEIAELVDMFPAYSFQIKMIFSTLQHLL